MKGAGFRFSILLFCFPLSLSPCCYAQKVINDKQFNYEVTIPDGLVKETYNDESDSSPVYYDTSTRIVLTVSGRKSKFTDIKSYLDCSKKDLEKVLQAIQEDSTLKLVECRKSPYYPDKAIVLHFETSAYSASLNRCFIYFFHHNGKEIQFFFLYNKTSYKESLDYIDRIMRSLTLVDS